mgnify:CR=1 FL=1
MVKFKYYDDNCKKKSILMGFGVILWNTLWAQS